MAGTFAPLPGITGPLVLICGSAAVRMIYAAFIVPDPWNDRWVPPHPD